MRVLILGCLFIFLMSACSSPMNQRVREGDESEKAAVELGVFSQLGYQVEVKWLSGPYGSIQQDNTLLVFLYQEGELVSLPEGQSLAFYATMPSMGHPMEDAGYFEEVDPGIFINKTIRYNMPGDWKNELWIMDAEFNILDRLEWDDLF